MTVIYEDKIFKVLCLMCKIMIYRLPVRDSIESSRVRDFKEELNTIIGDVE